MAPVIISQDIKKNGTTVTTAEIPFAHGLHSYDTVTVDGLEYVLAGTSSVYAGVGGSYAYSNIQTGSSTGGAINIWSKTVSGSTLAVNGDRLTFDVTIFAANTANNKQVTITFGGTTIGDTTNIAAQNGHAVIRGTIQRFSSTHCYCSCTCQTATKWVQFCTYTDVTATLSSNQTFNVTAATATANNDTLFRLGWLRWEPSK